MNSPTLRTRLALLIQTSKKALRLYTSMGRKAGRESAGYSDQQIEVWRQVNEELFQSLVEIAKEQSTRAVLPKLFELRDEYHSSWRSSEAELRIKQDELVASANSGDFVNCVEVGLQLIKLKATVQATEAAHQELQGVIGDSRPRSVSASEQDLFEQQEDQQEASRSFLEDAEMRNKVIPIRRRR